MASRDPVVDRQEAADDAGDVAAQGDLALAHGLCKVFSIGTAALDVVPDKFDVYCHTSRFFTVLLFYFF